MKITIRKLGVIEEATFDLRPLTIFIGPNNAGKTWLAYAIAGILGPHGTREYVRAYTDKKIADLYEQLDNAIEQVLKEGNATIDLRRFADEHSAMYFNNVASLARNWMKEFLITQWARFDDMTVSLELAEAKARLLNQISQYALRSNVAVGSKGPLLTIRKTKGEDKIYAYTSSESQDVEGHEEDIGEKIPPGEVRERLIHFVSTALRRSLYPQVRVFPTERTALVTGRFGTLADREQPRLSEREVEVLEALVEKLDIRALTKQTGAGKTTGPVAAFLTMHRNSLNIGTREREDREKNARSDVRIRKYIDLAEVLEKQVLSGSINFSTPEPDPRREVLYQPAQDVNLELPIASSMVKELSPLVLYLRYLAKPGELLIIDEPEMNLHPAAQVQIIEFLAMLVNAGLHVLVTTHSTYVVDHLINLMDASKHAHQDDILEMFLLERKDAFISQDKVSVYYVDDGKVENILDPEGIIHWQTFSEITKLVQSIHFDLLGE